MNPFFLGFEPLQQRAIVFLATLALVIGFDLRERTGVLVHRLWRAGAALMILDLARRTAGAVYRHLFESPTWDVMNLWLYGRAVAMGLDPYQPFTGRLEAPGPVAADFVEEVMDVGAVYHPHGLVLLSLPGSLDYPVARALWIGLEVVLLVAVAVGMARRFHREAGADGLLLSGALLALCYPVFVTLYLGQTNLLLLGLLLLCWSHRQRALAGAWIALGFAVKPWFAILGVHALIERRWRAAVSAIAGFVVLTGIAIVAIGPEAFLSFFLEPPPARMPDWFSSQPVNQSLSAWLARRIGLAGSEVYSHALFVGLASGIAVTTLALSLRRAASLEIERLCLLLSATLLIYPETLMHYATLLLFPIAALIERRRELPGGAPAAALAAATLLAALVDRHGHRTFYAIALMWLSLAVVLGGRMLIAPLRDRHRASG